MGNAGRAVCASYNIVYHQSARRSNKRGDACLLHNCIINQRGVAEGGVLCHVHHHVYSHQSARRTVAQVEEGGAAVGSRRMDIAAS
jgi:hypothetical protein